MTFYEKEVLKIKTRMYADDALCNRIIRSKQLMEHRFYDKININNIAGEVFISRFHYTRLFKTFYGRTPHQYLTEIRIAKAKHLLRMGTSVSQTCFAVGFESTTSFARLFRKFTGTNPFSLRKKTLQESKFR